VAARAALVLRQVPGWLEPVLRPIWPDRISWDELVTQMDEAVRMPGVSNAWTMPIKGRIDMLTTGVGPGRHQGAGPGSRDHRADRPAPRGDHPADIRDPKRLRERVTSGNFLDIVPRRDDLARYGLTIDDLQSVIMSAIVART